MPTLRVLAGPSPDDLTPITELVNRNVAHPIVSTHFEGKVVVFIKGLNQDEQACDSPEYFQRADRSGITWSIQVQGRFLSPLSSDDVLFGNIFERPLKLPWGTSAALKFMKVIDPTLEHDLTCSATQKPWALSPLVSTMPHLAHTRLAGGDVIPDFPRPTSIADDTSLLHLCIDDTPERSATPSSSSSGSSRSSKKSTSSNGKKQSKPTTIPPQMTSSQRRSFFATSAHRRAVVLGPDDLITTDFCYGFLQFSPSLRLKLPGGLGFDLARYWDGQPVRFVCCERKREDDASENPWGRPLWCVSIELEEDETIVDTSDGEVDSNDVV
ncbi:hypothetical protein MKEN_00662700 [Mycena kentingensis (nom. inval.)]|nr:hypothetical protein MKEN_00662700 [Mycena kentingensis (nom. inval.)]